jgi:hypothetical protein
MPTPHGTGPQKTPHGQLSGRPAGAGEAHPDGRVGGDAAHAAGHQADDPWQDLDDLMVSLSMLLLETAAVRALPGR